MNEEAKQLVEQRAQLLRTPVELRGLLIQTQQLKNRLVAFFRGGVPLEKLGELAELELQELKRECKSDAEHNLLDGFRQDLIDLYARAEVQLPEQKHMAHGQREKSEPTFRYLDVWLRDEPLEKIKSRILHGKTEEAVFNKAAENDLKFLLAKDFELGKPDVILDFGCGIGRLIRVLCEKFEFQSIYGLDVNIHSIEGAKERVQDPRAIFLTYDGGIGLPFPDNFFTKIYSVLTIQHIDEHVAFFIFKDMIRVLRPGGRIVLQLHNWGGRSSGIAAWWERMALNVVEHYPEQWLKFYTKEEIEFKFQELLKVRDIRIGDWEDSVYPGQWKYYRVSFSKP